MHRIITIIGTDGSGKTTLATEVVRLLRAEGIDASREWLGAESYLVAPLRAVMRRFWSSPGGQTKKRSTPHALETYRDEVRNKNRIVATHAWAKQCYLALVMADYRWQLWWKLRRNRGRDVVIADRYIFDVIVNSALTLGWDVSETVAYVQQQCWRFPMARLGVLIRVSPEVSMSRKDDIPDADYVRLRLAHYEAVAAAFGFEVLDGTREIPENATHLLDLVRVTLTKRCVHYVHSNNEDVGGADLVLVSMAKHMRHWGEGMITAVHLRLATHAARAHAAAGTPVAISHFIRPQVSTGLRGAAVLALLGPVTIWHFWRIFGRQHPDLVHVNDAYDFLPAVAARLRGIPVVFHLRMIKAGTIGWALSRLLPRLSTAVVSVSAAVQEHYRFEIVPVAGNHVIHDLGNAILVGHIGDISTAQTRPTGLPQRGRMVVMVGRLDRWKGQHIFLSALSRIPSSVRQANSFALVGGRVPGQEAYAENVEREAHHLGVVNLGARGDVPEILLSSDVSVHCSVAPDPFPGVVIESMLAGAATVAANAGGVPEMIDSPSVGVLYEAGASAELADAILDLLMDSRAPRARFGILARNRALHLVSAREVDAQIGSLYTGILVTHANKEPHATYQDKTQGET